jgi:NADH-quinone oxidoreductase subunit G
MIDVCPVGALTDKTFRFKSRVWFNKPYNAHRECTTPGCCGKTTFNVWNEIQRLQEEKMYEVEEFICNECRFDHRNLLTGLLKDQEHLTKILLSIKIITLKNWKVVIATEEGILKVEIKIVENKHACYPFE